MWKLLDKSPARWGDYLIVYILKFCVSQWVDNDPFVERASDLWDSVVLLIKDYLSRPASKRPQNNTLYDARDKGIIRMRMKLHVFHDIASMLNWFSTAFLSNAPLVSLKNTSEIHEKGCR